MSPQQFTIDGIMVIPGIEGTLTLNLRKFLIENPEYRKVKSTTSMIWEYLQKYHGVSDAISREQFFNLPKIDSIRRIWTQIVREFSN